MATKTGGRRRRSTGQPRATPIEPISMDLFYELMLDFYLSNDMPYGTVAGIRRVLDILRDDVGVRSSAELEDAEIFRRFTEICASKKFTQGTTDTMLARLRTITRKGHRDLGLLRSMPDSPEMRDPRHLPRSVRSVPPPAAEIARLLEYLQGKAVAISGYDERNPVPWDDNRLFAVVATIALTGIPLVAALQIRVTDIDLPARRIYVRVQRSGRRLEKKISEGLAATLAAWRPMVVGEYLFPARKQVGPWYISGRDTGNGPHPGLKNACYLAKVSHITFEMLRRFHKEQFVEAPPFEIPGRSTDAGRRPSFKIGGPDDAVELVPQSENPKSATSQTKHVTVSSDVASIEIISGTRVLLSGGQQVEVRESQLDVIRILLDAFPGGVSLSEMKARSKYGGCRTNLGLLVKNPEFARRIRLPGTGYPGKRTNPYRILSCSDVCETV
jgi:integrase